MTDRMIRVGIVGLGENTRLMHVPGLQACDNVEIIGVCNRRSESTQKSAQDYSIPKTYDHWEELVADADIDAVVIGTWPYLHCAITLAALENGKHILTEARMAMNADEARKMLAASENHPDLVTQIVPCPVGLRVGTVVKELLADGYIGDLREVVVLGTSNGLANPETPLHWRQSLTLSGVNMLALGILHELVIRWVPDPVRVLAQTHTFTTQRPDPASGELVAVERPDNIRILTELPGGARGLYHLSGVLHHGPGLQVHLYGTEGTLKFDHKTDDRLLGARADNESIREIYIPETKASGWRVEEEFINAIRGLEEVKLTDFASGVRYMEFTEAVENSATTGTTVNLPCQD